MSLQTRLNDDLKTAMLAKDSERVGALRLLKSALGYLLIERKTETLPDSDFVSLVQKEVKKRQDAIEQYEIGGRPESAAKEKLEQSVLEGFLPKPLAPEELDALVKTTISELNATSKKDMGSVIKAVQAKAAGRADGKTISSLVGKLLP